MIQTVWEVGQSAAKRDWV